MGKTLIVGNSSELLNMQIGSKIDNFDTIIRFNDFSYKNNIYKDKIGEKIDIHIINRTRMLPRFNENKLYLENLKLIINDQKNVLEKEYKKKYTYISREFNVKMRKKFNLSKNISLGLITIFYYLFQLKYKRIYITNFDLNDKCKDNIFTKVQPSPAHDFVKEKKIIKSLIKDNRIKYLT